MVVLTASIADPFGVMAQNADAPVSKSRVHRAFGIECTLCHTTGSWKELRPDIEFDHSLTGFSLTGRHAAGTCAGCHARTTFKDLRTACVTCHTDQHKGEFGDNCQDCHTPSGWRAPNEQVARHNLTRFPLLGAHEKTECERCHVNQQTREYVNTPVDCYSCHAADFAGATEPDHTRERFDRNCTTCHASSALSWRGGFTHPFISFGSSSAHAPLTCAQCHARGYAGTPTECYGCHADDFAGAVTPNHVSGNFDHACVLCHQPSTWKPATFNHDASRFPLRGKHAVLPCTQCHPSGYSALPGDCWSCHQNDYAGAASPNHAQGQFDRRCETCHSADGWRPATFDHANTDFPLTGAHRSAACAACHKQGDYTIRYTDCYQCHQEDFIGATSPANHAELNLSHACAECHTQTAWEPATPFRTSHNVNAPQGFPIYGSVRHSYPNRWSACRECHTSGNTMTFCCTTCHEHSNRQKMDDEHRGKTGYSFTCTSCADSGCHPSGRAD